MSMSEFERIFRNDNGKAFRVSMNVANIKGRWHDFVLQEGMVYGIHRFNVKSEEKANFLYIYAGKKRLKNGAPQVQLWLRNNLDPRSDFFDWKPIWLDACSGFTAKLYQLPVRVKFYGQDYKPDYSKPSNNLLSYSPMGGKSIGALFEYNGYGIKHSKRQK